MAPNSETAPLLVVGAGPTGLFVAIELHRQGVACRIIAKSAGPCAEARATTIHSRTLEIFERTGLIEAFLARGEALAGARIYGDGAELIADLDLRDVETPYPFELTMPQSLTEELLEDHLRRLGQTVERETELVSFTQDRDGVRARLRHADDSEETIVTPYLLGCDGSHSTVRHGLGIPLEGRDYPDTHAIADLRLRGPIARDKLSMFCSPELGVFLSPLPQDRFLFACDLPTAEAEAALAQERPTLAQVQSYLDRAGPGNVEAYEPTWLGYFRCHLRIAPQYSSGRVFLLGDAAHVHSPSGGQGMNTGFQDGFNLAWKIALVLRGAAPGSLLDSYHAERHYIGREVLKLTDGLYRQMFRQHETIADRIRKSVAGFLVQRHLVHPRVHTTDQTRVAYHHSPIVMPDRARRPHEPWSAAVLPGDRAPDGDVVIHPSRENVRLFRILSEPVHHLIVFEGRAQRADRAALRSFATDVTEGLDGIIRAHAVLSGEPPDGASQGQYLLDPEGALHERYAARRAVAFLIRPDGHVAYHAHALDAAALRQFLAGILSFAG